MTSLFVAFLLLSLLPPSLYLGYGYVLNKKKGYSFRSYFSYEMFGEEKTFSTILLRIIEALAVLSLLLSGVFGLICEGGDTNLSLYFIAFCLLGLVASLSHYFLSFIDLSFAKAHFALFFLEAAALILFAAMNGFYFSSIYRNLNEPSFLLIAILSFLYLLIALLILVNPKMKDWAKLEKRTNEKGEVSYSRPKRFVLPYSEWIIYFLLILANVTSLIGIYLISLGR